MSKGAANSSKRSLVMLRHIYTKDLKHARNQVYYIVNRSQETEREEREVFDASSTNPDWGKFGRELDNRSTRHFKQIKSHHLTISMRRADYDRYGGDYKEMIREMMKNLEREKGMKLDWIAATHMKANNPHVHVIIKGVGVNEQGKTKRLFFKREDYKQMRGSLYSVLRDNRARQRAMERLALREMQELRRAERERMNADRRQQREKVGQVRDVAKVGKSLLSQIRQLMAEEERQREWEQRNRRSRGDDR